MDNSLHKKRFDFGEILKSKKLTVVLGIIAAILLIAVIVMIIMLPKNTEAPTETAAPTETVIATETVDMTETETVPATETVPVETGPDMLPHMAAWYEKNPDTIGYIRIDGTVIDYPVVQTPDDPLEYTYKSFDGNFKAAGSIILDAKCNMDPECMNLILHGHNMLNGSMFKSITYYSKKSFWEENPEIYYSTLYEDRVYEVVYFFQDKIYDPEADVFKFYNFTDAANEEDFNAAMKYFAKRAKYDTGITPQYGDRLLTLVTCDYGTPNGRFVVVARLKTAE